MRAKLLQLGHLRLEDVFCKGPLNRPSRNSSNPPFSLGLPAFLVVTAQVGTWDVVLYWVPYTGFGLEAKQARSSHVHEDNRNLNLEGLLPQLHKARADLHSRWSFLGGELKPFKFELAFMFNRKSGLLIHCKFTRARWCESFGLCPHHEVLQPM